MTSSLPPFIGKWVREDDTDDILELWEQIDWLRKELFDSYEPSDFVHFDDRLGRWLANVSDDGERRAMFRLLRNVFFVGRQQFASLSRAAFNDAVTRWIIDLDDLDVTDPGMQGALTEAMSRTWFCPITDSMSINTFLKINLQGGHSCRPDWRSFVEMGSPEKIRAYVKKEGIQRVVLLEDFVGSGTQMTSSVEWAAETLPNTPMLVAPLVCCPGGVDAGADLVRRFPWIRFEPTLSLRPELFLLRSPQLTEPDEFDTVRAISEREAHRFGRSFDEPFGFHDTGALVVLHGNTPDNTLPLLHDQGTAWDALFPRISRN